MRHLVAVEGVLMLVPTCRLTSEFQIHKIIISSDEFRILFLVNCLVFATAEHTQSVFISNCETPRPAGLGVYSDIGREIFRLVKRRVFLLKRKT